MAKSAPSLPWFGPPSVEGNFEGVTHIVLFDVDGTLLENVAPGSNRAQHNSFRDALRVVWGVEGGLEDLEHAGKTDRWILRDLHTLTNCKLLPVEDAIDKAAAHMEAYCASCGFTGDGLSVLPGVVELLEGLKQSGKVVLGLVTGNLQAIAWGKVRSVGLESYFSCGGFGSDAEDRAELIRVALGRAAVAHPGLPPASSLRVFHVGDTPRDLEAAVKAGVEGVGVGTGKFTQAELKAAFPCATVLGGLCGALGVFGVQ